MVISFDSSTIKNKKTSEKLEFRRGVVCDLIKFIEENLEFDIDIEGLVNHSGFSRRYIQMIFSECLKMPVGRFIRHRRMMRAATLLRLTNSPIIDIVYRLGFDSQQSFTREFKKITGSTPQSYRKDKVWDLSPYRIIIPHDYFIEQAPELCMLNDGMIFGYQISYEEPVPCKRIMGDLKWSAILKYQRNSKKDIWILTQFSPSSRSFHNVNICTSIGGKNKADLYVNFQFKYKSGLYAKFKFAGSRAEYHDYILNIYYKYLPLLRLNRREGCDIEMIYYNKNLQNENFECDIYIPISHSNQYK